MGHKKKHKSPPEKLDIALIEALRPWLHHPIVKAVATIGKIGDEPPLQALSAATAVAGLLAGDRRLARTGTAMLTAHLIATGIKAIGKHTVDRSRPREMMKDGRYKMAPGHSRDSGLQSFPSGHTAGSVALARAVARAYPDRGGQAYAAAGAIGALQIARRAHFPSDILAGAIAGVVAEAIGERVVAGAERAIIRSRRAPLG